MLELGAGTGELGLGIAARVERYVAIEASAEMAKIWRQRFATLEQPESTSLLQQDADAPWPLGDRSVDLVFVSRAAHWLNPEHLLSEFARVGRGAAALLLGRVAHAPTHPQLRLRGWMHDELRRLGYAPKDGPRQGSELVGQLVERDPAASWLPERWLLSWPTQVQLETLLERWRRKPVLAGVELPSAARQALLDRVAARAEAALGPLHRSLACEEGYAVQGARLRAGAAHSRSAAPNSPAVPCVRLTSRLGGPIPSEVG